METVACAECDLLQRFPPIPPGGKARCPRCGNTLATQPGDPLDRPLALAVTAAIVFLPSRGSAGTLRTRCERSIAPGRSRRREVDRPFMRCRDDTGDPNEPKPKEAADANG